MKLRLVGLFLVVMLAASAMTGCRMASNMASTGDTLKQTVDTTASAPGKHKNPVLTLEEAQNIALKHAGFTADQVTLLHTEYEVEHGIPKYDVEFHHGSWEYDYEIHADSGKILSYSRDD